MGIIRTFDPARHAPPERPPTRAEEEAVLSGSGAVWAGGTFETNSALLPTRVRGCYPSPGIYEEDARRDPIIAAGLWRRSMYAASMDWRLLDAPDSTPEEEDRSQFARDCLASLGGGMAGLITRIYTREQFGFSIFEKVWEVEETTLRWRLESLEWIHPMTVTWGFSASGHMVGFWQRSEKPLVWLPRSKLAHFVRGDTGRNPEGVSALRPLHYYIDAKGQAISNWVATMHLFAEGWLDVVTDATRGKDEWNELEAGLQAWQDGDRRYFMHNPETQIDAKYGGSVLPDLSETTAPFNSELRSGLDENLQALGENKYGARAVGAELRASSHETLAGEATDLAARIRSEIVVPIYEKNGWDVTRAPTVIRRGQGFDYQSVAMARLIGEMLRDGSVPEEKRAAAIERWAELIEL